MTDTDAQQPPEGSLEAKWGNPPDEVTELEEATQAAFKAVHDTGVQVDVNPLLLRVRLETLIDMLCEQKCIEFWDYHSEFHRRITKELEEAAQELRRAKLTGGIAPPGTNAAVGGMNRAARRKG